MEQPPTEEEIQRHISAAFDSVSAIERTISGEDTYNNPVSWVEANVGHLNIMLGKDWFVAGLTEQQRTDIDAIIASGNQYIAEHSDEEPTED
jgi:hypothetical protein